MLSTIPTDPRVSDGSLDKVGHLCEYLVFAWLLVQAIRATRTREREYLLWACPPTNLPDRKRRGSRARGRRNGSLCTPDASGQVGGGAWLYATSYGGLMELLQMALPWRRADWTDALTNALGAALGAWLGTRWPAPQRDIA